MAYVECAVLNQKLERCLERQTLHEIKHDGYRIIVRRDGERVRLFSRKAIDWTARLPAIADGPGRLKAKSFTLDGEAVVVEPNGLTDFEALRRRGAVTSPCSTPSISWSMTAAISDTGVPVEAVGRDPVERAHFGGRPGRVRPCLPARRRGHCVKASRIGLQLGPLPRRGGLAAGARGEVESVKGKVAGFPPGDV
jgi:bifunctional non-homologous end joining protein LigD